MISNGDGLRRWRVAGAASAIVLAVVLTLGATSAAFTATTPVTCLYFRGAPLGPGTHRIRANECASCPWCKVGDYRSVAE
jgi:hypothetical protein